MTSTFCIIYIELAIALGGFGGMGFDLIMSDLLSTVPVFVPKSSSRVQGRFVGLTLLSKGAKYMVVQGLPTTGCLTLAMTLAPESDRDDMGCVASQNKQSYDHNTILQTKISDLRQKYPQNVIIYADYWNAYRSVVKNAPKLGFKEIFKVCCGSEGAPYNFDVLVTCGSQSSTSCKDPAHYINWDGVHLTEAMNKAVSEEFLKGGLTHPPFASLMSSLEYSG